MSKQIDRALCGDVAIPVFCPECCKVIPAEVSVFGRYAERELMYIAEVLLDAHRRSFHGKRLQEPHLGGSNRRA